jgi:hypothetical protein
MLRVRFHALDERPERGCASLEVPGHVDQPLTVRQRLLAVLPEGNAGMSPDGLQQHGDGLRDGPAVTPSVKPAQEVQRVGDLDACGIKGRAVDGLHRIEAPGREGAIAIDLLPKNEKGLIAQREEGTAQRGKDFEFVIDPAWVEEIEAMCRLSGTAFFFKQWGGKNKKAAGRTFRGRTFDEMPRVQSSY